MAPVLQDELTRLNSRPSAGLEEGEVANSALKGGSSRRADTTTTSSSNRSSSSLSSGRSGERSGSRGRHHSRSLLKRSMQQDNEQQDNEQQGNEQGKRHSAAAEPSDEPRKRPAAADMREQLDTQPPAWAAAGWDASRGRGSADGRWVGLPAAGAYTDHVQQLAEEWLMQLALLLRPGTPRCASDSIRLPALARKLPIPGAVIQEHGSIMRFLKGQPALVLHDEEKMQGIQRTRARGGELVQISIDPHAHERLLAAVAARKRARGGGRHGPQPHFAHRDSRS